MVKFPWIQTNPDTITAMSDSDSGLSYSSNGTKKLVHHKIGKKATSTDLTCWLEPNEFKWMLSGASCITETQTCYFIGDDGSFCMVQMAYTNLTWPYTNCQVTARYYKPGTNNSGSSTGGAKAIHKFETQTLSAMRMKLTDEKASCALESSSITMKTNGNSCNMTSDPDFNFNINYAITPSTASQPSPFTLDLTFEPKSAPFQINGGQVQFGATKTDGFIEMKFIPAGRCEGKISIDGEEFDFHGFGMSVRQFQGVKPHLTTKRWNCIYFRENSSDSNRVRTLFMVQMQCSSSYNGEIVNNGFYFDGEKLQAVTSQENELVYAKTSVDPDTGYSVPEHFDYRWKGIDMDGKSFDALVCGTHQSRMARIDLLENVPIFFRKIVEAFCPARPYIYQNLNQDVEAVINGEKLVGTLFQEFSFLLEDPSQWSKKSK